MRNAPEGRGELVYEPFLGSGTTLAAAELTERVCCGMELDPKYVDVIVQRWQTLSGKQAVLGSWVIDGEPGGMGIRESSGPVTNNTSCFVAHLFR